MEFEEIKRKTVDDIIENYYLDLYYQNNPFYLYSVR